MYDSGRGADDGHLFTTGWGEPIYSGTVTSRRPSSSVLTTSQTTDHVRRTSSARPTHYEFQYREFTTVHRSSEGTSVRPGTRVDGSELQPELQLGDVVPFLARDARSERSGMTAWLQSTFRPAGIVPDVGLHA